MENSVVIITSRIPKTLRRYCFHRCLSVHISGEGVPPSGYYFLTGVGVPHLSRQGVPPSFLGGGGVGTPILPDGGGGITTIPDQDRGIPIQDQHGGGTPCPGQVTGQHGGGGGLLPTGTAQQVLATRWAVCLLSSCRRTFLEFPHISKKETY